MDNGFIIEPDNGDNMEDISSSSGSKAAKIYSKVSEPINTYSASLFKNLGGTIKVIAFIIAFILIIIGFGGAFFLFSFLGSYFIPVALGVILVFTAIAAFTFFIIYGMGQIICQNDEILKRLKK